MTQPGDSPFLTRHSTLLLRSKNLLCQYLDLGCHTLWGSKGEWVTKSTRWRLTVKVPGYTWQARWQQKTWKPQALTQALGENHNTPNASKSFWGLPVLVCYGTDRNIFHFPEVTIFSFIPAQTSTGREVHLQEGIWPSDKGTGQDSCTQVPTLILTSC